MILLLQENFLLYIEAKDEDILVDNFLDNIFIRGYLNVSTMSPVISVTGVCGKVSMTVQYQRVCQSNYYNRNCSTYCLEANDATRGHYTCNSGDGAKLCLPGYEGENCLQSNILLYYVLVLGITLCIKI